jgi:hypothetical protein
MKNKKQKKIEDWENLEEWKMPDGLFYYLQIIYKYLRKMEATPKEALIERQKALNYFHSLLQEKEKEMEKKMIDELFDDLTIEGLKEWKQDLNFRIAEAEREMEDDNPQI